MEVQINDDRGWQRWRNRKAVLPALMLVHKGKCHWCCTPVILTKMRMNNQATVDHLKTRAQGRQHYHDGGHVLACYRCNHKRNNEELKELARKRQQEKALYENFLFQLTSFLVMLDYELGEEPVN